MRTWPSVIAAGICCLFLSASVANAATIYACRKKVGGTIRIVGASTTCQGTETKISWNTVGPRGPRGYQGIQGIPGITDLAGKKCAPGYYLSGFDEAGNLLCVDRDVPLPGSPEWANTQWPPSISVSAGVASDFIYGQVYMSGVTEAAGAAATITAELGVGADGTDPATHSSWIWYPASYSAQVANNDEYQATLTLTTPGTYDYCFRFASGGSRFVYGDLDGSGNGYSPGQAGSLLVNP